jgi:hypothetical protein
MDIWKIGSSFNSYVFISCLIYVVVIFIFVRILAYITGVNSACGKKTGCFVKIYLCITVVGITFMRNYSNLDCRIHDSGMIQFVPLTFDKYVFGYSLRTNQTKLISHFDYYTIKNNVIYGHFDYEDRFFTYDYSEDTELMTYNYLVYFDLVKENGYPHPSQFRINFKNIMI